jgi:DNA polymerase epsilon subunit 4
MREKYRQEGNTGGAKELSKLMGDKWKQLTKEERDHWSQVAQLQEKPVVEKKPREPSDSKVDALPVSRIKKIMRVDEDVKTLSKEAINLVGRATELFLEYFARECHEVAVSFKKKTITPQHFDLTARRTSKLEFLKSKIFLFRCCVVPYPFS